MAKVKVKVRRSNHANNGANISIEGKPKDIENNGANIRITANKK